MGFTFWTTVHTVRSSSSKLLHSTWYHITINDTLAVSRCSTVRFTSFCNLRPSCYHQRMTQIKSRDTNCLSRSIKYRWWYNHPSRNQIFGNSIIKWYTAMELQKDSGWADAIHILAEIVQKWLFMSFPSNLWRRLSIRPTSLWFLYGEQH